MAKLFGVKSPVGVTDLRQYEGGMVIAKPGKADQGIDHGDGVQPFCQVGFMPAGPIRQQAQYMEIEKGPLKLNLDSLREFF